MNSCYDDNAPPVSANSVAAVIWTRWNPRSSQNAAVVADAVVSEACRFVFEALGEPPKAIFLLKTPGDPASSDAERQLECDLWEGAVKKAQAALGWAGTDFEYRYHPQNLPVCSSWEAALRLSRWWTKAEVCAFVNMDHIDARLPGALQLTRLPNDLPEEVRCAIREASAHFGELVGRTLRHRGLTVGGYRVYEVDPSLLARRNGLAAKCLLEAALRCYTSGVLPRFGALQKLLERHPRLQIRSETFSIHRECWERLRTGKRLIFEPVEAMIGLILGALLEKCVVEQVDFGIVVEEGAKPDSAIVDQLRRGMHVVDRLKQAWFQPEL